MVAPSILEIETRHQGEEVRVVLRGELDISTAERLEEELRQIEEAGPGEIVLDLRALGFIDSSGLRVIVEALRRAGQSDRGLALIRGPEEVDRVLRLTGLDQRLEIREPD